MIRLSTAVVHPWLCDSMGHLTTRHYSAIFDDAVYHLFFEAFSYSPLDPAWHRLGWADVNQSFDYKAEVLVGELLEVVGTVTALGRKSVSTELHLLKRGGGNLAAIARSVTVLFDKELREAVELPDHLRQSADRLMKG